MKVSFTGQKIFNNMAIISNPPKINTSMGEDIEDMSRINLDINAPSTQKFHKSYSPFALENPQYKIIFEQGEYPPNLHQVFVLNLKENIARKFIKHEFSDKSYLSAFQKLAESISKLV